MNNKYKLLSYMGSPSPSKTKTPFRERFGKLTLGSSAKSKSRKSSSSNKDQLNKSLITDDESDNENEGQLPDYDKQKLIRKILCSNSDSEQEGPLECPIIQNKSQIFEISQNLEMHDSDEDEDDQTHCTVEDSGKKDDSEYIARNEQKESTPLFSISTSSEEQISKNLQKRKSSSDDTVVSRLSTQMDRLGLIDDIILSNKNENLSDDNKIRNSKRFTNHVQYIKEVECDNRMSVLTISSTASESSKYNDSNNEGSFESANESAKSIILITDSDSDGSSELSPVTKERYENHVSSISSGQGSREIVSQSVINKLNDFFNNIPSFQSLQRNESGLFHMSTDEEIIPATPEKSQISVISEHEIIPETPEKSINSNTDILETPKSDIFINACPKINEKESRSRKSSPIDENKNNVTEINISAKIQINIQISEIDNITDESHSSETRSESNEQNSCKNETMDEISPDNSLATTKSSIKSNDLNSILKEKYLEKDEPRRSRQSRTKSDVECKNKKVEDDTVLNTPSQDNNNDKFSELNKSNFEIDADMEEILNEMYGDEWKTPQMLQKCSSKKNTNTTIHSSREANESYKHIIIPECSKSATKCLPRISERSDMADFSMFHKNIPPELHSTRIETAANKNITGSGKKSIKKKTDAKKHLDFEPSPPLIRQRQKRKAAENVKKILRAIDSESEVEDDSFILNSSSAESDEDFEINLNTGPKKRIGENKDKKVKPAAHRQSRRSLYGMETIETLDTDSDSSNISDSDDDNDDDEDDDNNIPKIKCDEIMPPPNEIPKSKRKLFNPNDWIKYDDSEIVEDPEDRVTLAPYTRVIDFSPGQWFKKPKNPKVLELKKDGVIKIKNPRAKKVTPKKTTNKENITELCPHKKYGFLESLDEKIAIIFCHEDAICYRENFQKIKEQLCNILYDMYNKNIFKFDVSIKIPITWNKRLSNTAGRCMTSKKKGIRACRIELSDKVLTHPGRLRCTLIHEMCHAATWIYNEVNGHGPLWKAWVDKSMAQFPELPQISVCHTYEIEYKYTYQCTICRAKSQAHSKSKKVDNIRCKMCHGSIEILLNKRNKNGDIILTSVRKPTAFANFVKENYPKKSNTPHGIIMKNLGAEFKNLSFNSKTKY